MKKKRPVDVVADLMQSWQVRDLTQDDFNKAISDLINISKEEKLK